MNKKETRFLVTTALEDTWVYDQPVLFLGEWCKAYPRKHIWQQVNNKTLSWHWDDKELLMKDQVILELFYEEMLASLVVILNQYHDVDYSNRYWRIILNPWLNGIVHVLYDRWSSIINAYNRYDISDCYCFDLSDNEMIPLHSMDFKQYVATSNVWNHYLFSKIIKFLGKKYTTVDNGRNYTVKHSNYKPSFIRLIKHNILKVVEGALSLRLSNTAPLFIQTMMDKKLEKDIQSLFISNKSGFVRRLVSGDYMMNYLQPDMPLRNKFKIKLNNDSLFGDFASDFIMKQIPVYYLEGYKKLIKISSKLNLPKHPKFIFTSRSHLSSETAKIHLAKATETGSKLYIANHGASYGAAKYLFMEEHEKKIADKMLSWGWGEEDNSNNVYPYGNTKVINKEYLSPKKDGKLLLVTVVASEYLVHFSSCIEGAASQWIQYTKNSQLLYTLFNQNIQEHFLLRLSPCYYNYWSNQKKRWSDFSSKINFSAGGTIDDEYKKSRIVIVDYDGTPFLECLSMDFPVLLIQNPEFEPLRDEALPYYKNLEGVGIYHKSIESAASHINSVWNSIDEWWYNNETIKVKEEFVYHFARVPERPLEDFKKIIDMEDNL